jgi:hypothetical protein
VTIDEAHQVLILASNDLGRRDKTNLIGNIFTENDVSGRNRLYVAFILYAESDIKADAVNGVTAAFSNFANFLDCQNDDWFKDRIYSFCKQKKQSPIYLTALDMLERIYVGEDFLPCSKIDAIIAITSIIAFTKISDDCKKEVLTFAMKMLTAYSIKYEVADSLEIQSIHDLIRFRLDPKGCVDGEVSVENGTEIAVWFPDESATPANDDVENLTLSDTPVVVANGSLVNPLQVHPVQPTSL